VLSELLAAGRLPADALMIEITETTVIKNFDQVKWIVDQLRQLGVEVSIDDFGAGFTSLAYLSSLAIAELKLDRSFITPVVDDTNSRHTDLVRATIDLGHALGLEVIAEGVEDPRDLQLLRELGCDIVQGYAVGPPAPATEPSFRINRDGTSGDTTGRQIAARPQNNLLTTR
jgi:EAL domain-containing protein (putative c-di-GMP-specific phosphodiesterase class I)